MDFATFLSKAATPAFWQTAQRFCFVGTEYPAGFFLALFNKIRTLDLLPAPYQKIPLTTLETKDVYATLNQSMLGSTSFFWLGNSTEERETKASLALSKFLASYTGPNIIAFFTQTADQAPADAITIPHQLTYPEFTQLARFFSANSDPKKLALVQTLFNHNSVSLATCCMLLTYLELAGARNQDAFKAYIHDLFGAQTGLNELADAFFACQATTFFAHWSKLAGTYPDVFWAIYWSEQLWRALHVAQFMQAQNFVAAKKMSYRLPYTFINRHWQKANQQELAAAYEFLYQIDFAIKTGSSFCSLDLFFMRYFNGTFV